MSRRHSTTGGDNDGTRMVPQTCTLTQRRIWCPCRSCVGNAFRFTKSHMRFRRGSAEVLHSCTDAIPTRDGRLKRQRLSVRQTRASRATQCTGLRHRPVDNSSSLCQPKRIRSVIFPLDFRKATPRVQLYLCNPAPCADAVRCASTSACVSAQRGWPCPSDRELSF